MLFVLSFALSVSAQLFKPSSSVSPSVKRAEVEGFDSAFTLVVVHDFGSDCTSDEEIVAAQWFQNEEEYACSVQNCVSESFGSITTTCEDAMPVFDFVMEGAVVSIVHTESDKEDCSSENVLGHLITRDGFCSNGYEFICDGTNVEVYQYDSCNVDDRSLEQLNYMDSGCDQYYARNDTEIRLFPAEGGFLRAECILPTTTTTTTTTATVESLDLTTLVSRGWELMQSRDALFKSFLFDSFSEAMGFMTRVSLAAEKMGKYPEWSNLNNRVDIILSTNVCEDKEIGSACNKISVEDVELATASVFEPFLFPVAKTLNGRMACASACAGNIQQTGKYDPTVQPWFHAGAGWIGNPRHFSDGALRIDAALVGMTIDGITVAVRGTLTDGPASIPDWLQDADANVTAHPYLPGQVHHGFSKALDKLWHDVSTEIKNLYTAAKAPKPRVYFTGHSKGAPVALFHQVRSYNDPKSVIAGVPTTSVLFAPPRPGNADFVSAVEKIPLNVTRFEAYDDLIPLLPPTPAFWEKMEVQTPGFYNESLSLHIDFDSIGYTSIGDFFFIDQYNMLIHDPKYAIVDQNENTTLALVKANNTQRLANAHSMDVGFTYMSGVAPEIKNTTQL